MKAGAVVTVAAWAIAMLPMAVHAQHDTQPTLSGRPPARVTMEELHRNGGVPAGWRFGLPRGDAGRGRQVFIDAQCYACHTIRGETFPTPSPERVRPGPDLTGMGEAHPPEYFAESILDPNAVIVLGVGFTGPDGLSIMPSFADSLSVAQLVDLVAYLRSQTGADTRRPLGSSTVVVPGSRKPEVQGRGIVRALVPGNDLVVIEHDEITGYMPAMTMGFRATSRSVYETVRAGDAVSFVLRLTVDGAVLTSIEKTAPP